ncbi:hypothetical protein A1353_23160 [Methylomonas methanica]|uniref:Uncharacterized protein n=1 Tax=Methylomonas methanica TaxID=421 RepID=A0A177LXX3_METMH|nr:hypothetical protein [Methylomonas methanica]OAH97388.1 hypothetical protein A1353_23160 [Methylomonas methanica]
MDFFQKIMGLSLPLKIVISSIVFAIAGPGFLYVITEYATYFYIVSLGVRPPFEGMSYLSASVALLGFILSTFAAIIFIITRFLINFIGGQIVVLVKELSSIADKGITEYRANGGFLLKNISFSNAVDSIQNLKLVQVLLLEAFFIVLIYTALKLVEINDTANYTLVFIFYITIAVFTIWSKLFSWIVAAIVVCCFYFYSFSFFVFDSDHYKAFLKIVGYGGNIPIEIEYLSGGQRESLNLILRTSTSLLGETKESGEHIEIPISNIKKITYKTLPEDSGRKDVRHP